MVEFQVSAIWISCKVTEKFTLTPQFINNYHIYLGFHVTGMNIPVSKKAWSELPPQALYAC